MTIILMSANGIKNEWDDQKTFWRQEFSSWNILNVSFFIFYNFNFDLFSKLLKVQTP